MLTVLQAFEKAYGPLPEGVTGCYVGEDVNYGECEFGPIVEVGEWNTMIYESEGRMPFNRPKEPPGWFKGMGHPVGVDIADRPASAFLGFFCEKYDKVVEGES